MENWFRVEYTAEQNIKQIREGVEASMRYDSRDAVHLALKVSQAESHVGNTFRNIRREWNGKEFILTGIEQQSGLPLVEQVRKWNTQLVDHYDAMSKELTKIIENASN